MGLLGKIFAVGVLAFVPWSFAALPHGIATLDLGFFGKGICVVNVLGKGFHRTFKVSVR